MNNFGGFPPDNISMQIDFDDISPPKKIAFPRFRDVLFIFSYKI